MEELLQALNRYNEAKAERDKARAECVNDWGYFGWREEDALKSATDELKQALNAVIDARIAATRDGEGE